MVVRFLEMQSYLQIFVCFVFCLVLVSIAGIVWLCVYFYKKYKHKKMMYIEEVDKMFVGVKHFTI